MHMLLTRICPPSTGAELDVGWALLFDANRDIAPWQEDTARYSVGMARQRPRICSLRVQSAVWDMVLRAHRKHIIIFFSPRPEIGIFATLALG